MLVNKVEIFAEKDVIPGRVIADSPGDCGPMVYRTGVFSLVAALSRLAGSARAAEDARTAVAIGRTVPVIRLLARPGPIDHLSRPIMRVEAHAGVGLPKLPAVLRADRLEAGRLARFRVEDDRVVALADRVALEGPLSVDDRNSAAEFLVEAGDDPRPPIKLESADGRLAVADDAVVLARDRLGRRRGVRTFVVQLFALGLVLGADFQVVRVDRLGFRQRALDALVARAGAEHRPEPPVVGEVVLLQPVVSDRRHRERLDVLPFLRQLLHRPRLVAPLLGGRRDNGRRGRTRGRNRRFDGLGHFRRRRLRLELFLPTHQTPP